MRFGYVLPLLSFFLLLNLSEAFGQRPGRLQGNVKGRDQQTVPHAEITLEGKNITVQANEYGEFTLSAPQGEYEVTVSAVGYIALKQKVQIYGGQTRQLHAVLEKDPGTTIDQVVVAGKTAIQEVRESPFNVVALDAKSQYNSTLDLAHLLDKAPGIKIRETGGVGSDMTVTLNGFTGRHVRIFMDGVPMQGMGSAFQLNNIPVSVAERIEVYKGVVPIEFGTDALGGVINIVTNQSSNTSVDVSYSYGSFNTHRTNINFGHTFKSGISLQLDAFQNYSDNNYRVLTEQWVFQGTDENGDIIGAHMSGEQIWARRFNDRYKNETVIARLGIVGKPWADRMLFNLTYGQMDRGIQTQADMRHVFGERSNNSKSILPSFTYDKRNLFVDGLSVRMTANYNYQRGGNIDTSYYRYNWEQDREPRNARGEQGNYVLSDFSNSNQSATVNIGYRINERHSVSLNNIISGYVRRPVLEEIPVEELSARDSMDRTSLRNNLGLSYRFTYNRRWNTNLFVKHYYNRATGPLEQTVNGRLDVVERQENASKTGYGLATTYFFTDLQLKASAERAYRLPTDQELFGDEILETGNITLRPENSLNLNVGGTLNKELNSSYTIYADVSAYYRDTRDFIRRTLQSNTQTNSYTFGNANHGRVTNLGTDAEIRLFYKNTAMIGTSVTYMNIRDKEPWLNAVVGGVSNPSYGTRMPNLPYFFGNVDVAYYVHNLFGKGNVLNLGYTLNFMEQMYLYAPNMGYIDSKSIIPRQLYSDFSATYIMKQGKYNLTFEARNMEDALLYDNFSLQKPGRNFSVKFRYFFIKRT